MPSLACRLRRRPTRLRAWVVAAVALPALVGTGLDAASRAASAEPALVLDHGHVDAFTLVWADGRLQVHLQEDVTGHHVLHQPQEVLLKIKDEARIALPDPVPPSMAFLGVGGEEVFFLPQTQDPDLLWPGWSTERISPGDFLDPMRLHVSAITGPGEVFLWQTGAFGASTPVLDSGGYRLPGDISATTNAHVHANWAFSEAGRYTMTVHASGTRRSGAAAVSTPVTYTFDVGDEGTTPAPSPAPPPTPPPTPTPGPTPPPAPTPDPGGRWNVPNGKVNKHGATVLNSGHVDIASDLDGKQLSTKVKDTTASSTPRWRDPATTVLQILPKSKEVVPDNPAYSFLGRTGAPFYQVTQTQQPGLLWPGWSTETIPTGATTGGVTWGLTDMTGPGEFALYETDPFGRPIVLFNTRDDITDADRFTIPKNTHAHGSWAFSKPGLYCLAGQRVTQLTTGETASDQFLLAVAVGTADVMNVDPKRCGEDLDDNPPVPAPPPIASPNGESPVGGASDRPQRESRRPETDAACAPIAPASTTKVLSAGHIDYAARVVDGRLVSQIGDDTSGAKVYREPATTVLWLKPASEVNLPSGYGQVGTPGTVVWQVPQTQDPALIWLGWSTEQLNAGNARGPVAWRLDQVDGPGTLKVYLSGSFGGVQEVVHAGPGSSYSIPLGVHTHANWAFSKEGTYRITSTQSVTLADGTRSSDTETMTIAVGDVAPTSTTAATDQGCAGGSDGAPGPVDVATVAAPQVGAPAATSGVTDHPGVSPEEPAVTNTAGQPEHERVPLLMGTLGSLLLVGAGGTGVLWWRRPSTARGPAA